MLLKNYLISTQRNFRKYKAFSAINILGLAVGLSIYMLTALYTAYSFDFDTFHPNAERIYGVVQVIRTSAKEIRHSAIIPAPFLPAMKSEFPEIENAVRYFSPPWTILKYEDKIFSERQVFFVDTNFLTFFNFEMTHGNPQTALSQRNTIVLTEAAALKYFGNENPVGKSLTINSKIDVKITGVLKNLPSNSSLRFDFLVPLETVRSLYDWMDNWNENSSGAFVLLPKGYAPGKLEAKFPTFLKKYIQDSPDAPERLYLFPLLDFRSQSESVNLASYLYWDSPYEIIYLFILLGIAALLIVVINFMNLSTAYHMDRAKEVGIRKVVGANRFKLITQFLAESVFMAFIALIVAIILYQFLRPAFKAFVGVNMDISLTSYPSMILVLLGVTAIVGLLAGSYPAFYLSTFKPTLMFKGSLKTGKKGSLPRKILVVSQFVLSIILIVFTVAAKNQLNYIYNMDFGYNRQGVIVVFISGSARDNLQTFKEQLQKHPDISTVSAIQTPLVNHRGVECQVIPEGFSEDEKWNIRGIAVDYDLIETLDIKMKEGRSFSRAYNDTDNFIINETAARCLHWKNPVGKFITMGEKKGVVIGVAKDFIFNDVHFKLTPTVLYLSPKDLNFMLIKTTFTDSSKLSQILPIIKEQWNILAPDIPFEHQILKYRFVDHYGYVTQMAVIFGAIGGFAILYSFIGLLGLTSYAVGRRTKEIGIRKTLGASVNTIFKMLSSEFLRLVVLANIIALPLSYFFIDGFLKWGWSYRGSVSIWAFVFAFILTLVTSIASISYHTLKAARTNPVEALRYE